MARTVAPVADERVRASGPSCLEALHGRVKGVLILPITVHWGPDATADLSTTDGLEKAYENVVREGTLGPVVLVVVGGPSVQVPHHRSPATRSALRVPISHAPPHS